MTPVALKSPLRAFIQDGHTAWLRGRDPSGIRGGRLVSYVVAQLAERHGDDRVDVGDHGRAARARLVDQDREDHERGRGADEAEHDHRCDRARGRRPARKIERRAGGEQHRRDRQARADHRPRMRTRPAGRSRAAASGAQRGRSAAPAPLRSAVPPRSRSRRATTRPAARRTRSVGTGTSPRRSRGPRASGRSRGP